MVRIDLIEAMLDEWDESAKEKVMHSLQKPKSMSELDAAIREEVLSSKKTQIHSLIDEINKETAQLRSSADENTTPDEHNEFDKRDAQLEAIAGRLYEYIQ